MGDKDYNFKLIYPDTGELAHSIFDVPFDPETLDVDLDKFEEEAQRIRPKLVVMGMSMTLFPLPVREISSIIEDRGLTQAEAAEIMGVDQPKVSALVRGRLDGFSMERLYRFLNALGRDVEIVVRPTPESQKGSRLRVTRKPGPSRTRRSPQAPKKRKAS